MERQLKERQRWKPFTCVLGQTVVEFELQRGTKWVENRQVGGNQVLKIYI